MATHRAYQIAELQTRVAELKGQPDVSENVHHRLEGAMNVPVSLVRANPRQPRRLFGPEALEELKASIKAQGVLQPVLLRRVEEERYEIVCGERRYRAVKELGWTTIPAIVRDILEEDVFLAALQENVLREDLTPVEEARAYVALLHGSMVRSQRDIARMVGISHTRVQQKLKLLELPTDIRSKIRPQSQVDPEKGEITERQAREILRVPDEITRRRIYKQTIRSRLSSRQVAAAARREMRGEVAVESPRDSKSPCESKQSNPESGRLLQLPGGHALMKSGKLMLQVDGSRAVQIQALRLVLQELVDENIL